MSGRSFLDIGCGSGLFSLAAYELGASKILSSDIDPLSVQCARSLWQQAGRPANWEIKQGSILDENFRSGSEAADIVYAWGTLQHTGLMWQAFRNASQCVKPGGIFYVGVYNYVPGIGPRSSKFWSIEKKMYSRLHPYFQHLFFYLAKFALGLLRVVSLKPPVKKMRRGMTHDINLKAWLGAWPCEFTHAQDVIRFCENELGLRLIKTNLTDRLGNNEFLFQRPGPRPT